MNTYNENLSFFAKDLLDECPWVGYTAPRFMQGMSLFRPIFIGKVVMPGLLPQFAVPENALPVERLSGTPIIVAIIGIIVVGVLITPLAGWVA